MATKLKKATLPHAGHVDVVPAKSPEKAAMLAAGYGMTADEARQIIAERDKDPHMWPWDSYQRAKAMLAALDAEPTVISKREGWKRDRPRRID